MDIQNAVQAAHDAQLENALVTLMAPLNGQPNKVYGPEGNRWSYDSRQSKFRHRQVTVTNTDKLHELIGLWAESGDSFIIPGGIREGAGRVVNRRKRPDPSKPYPPDVIEVPVSWACFDLDQLPSPLNVRASPEEAARYAIEQIALVFPHFDELSLVVQASNSCGQPGKEYIAKFHFWFLLSKSSLPPELKEIVKRANRRYQELNPELAIRFHRETGKEFTLIDDALFQACQPNFVANPKFVGGAVDPMAKRIWKVEGECERLVINPDDFPALDGALRDQRRPGSTSANRKAKKTAGQRLTIAEPSRKAVTKPADITGNSSRNKYFILQVRETLARHGPQFDRSQLVQQLRNDLQKSQAEDSDIERWSSDAYLLYEIKNCERFLKNQQGQAFTINSSAHLLNEFSAEYLTALPDQEGVLLVKSHMGSGKTWGLKERLKSAVRVLVIVHRQSLAHDVARRLGLTCYLDIKSGDLNQDRLVVCVNSLHRMSRFDYDLVVIEESEQLLRHLANLSQGQRPTINHEQFRACIQQAKQVIALDAQLSDLSVHTLELIRPSERFSIWRNTFASRKQIRMYDEKAGLISAFDQAVQMRSCGAGKPVAMVTNSRRLAEQQYERVQLEYPALKCGLITSRTTGEPAIKALLKDFDAEGAQYDVIFSSPTMSTGVSIERLDFRVFGIFDANVTCHTDCAQAISRFRLPDQVEVFVAKGKAPLYPATQIVEARLRALKQHDIYFANDGREPSFRADLFLRVQAYEEQSKGCLRQNFLQLAEESGWVVQSITTSKDGNIHGAGLIVEGREIEDEVRTERLLTAERLSDAELVELGSKSLRTSLELDALERTRMERFYFQPISSELIKRDHRGSYRKALRNLELLQDETPELLAEDRAAAVDWDAFQASFRSKGISRRLWSLFLRVVGLPENGRLDGFRVVSEKLVFRERPSDPEGIPVDRVFEGWNKETLNHPALAEIQARRVEIKAFLGRTVPADFMDNPVSFINQSLKEGLAIPIGKSRPGTAAGKGRAYQYTLDSARLVTLNADRLRRARGLLGDIGIDDADNSAS
jgi:Origin of replication binding protein